MRSKAPKEILLALSISNLLYISTWRKLLYPEVAEYHIIYGPSAVDYFAAICCVLVTTFVLIGAVSLIRRFYPKGASVICTLGFLLLFLFALASFSLQFGPFSPLVREIGTYLFVLLLLLFVLVSFVQWRGRILTPLRAVILILTPFTLITFSNALLAAITNTASADDRIVRNIGARPDPKEVRNRVVWIIFDEFDYRIPFELKPVEMPEFEKLKNESLMATNAESPARYTLESIPSLLTGRPVTKSETRGKDRLLLNFRDGSAGALSDTSTVFSSVNDMRGTSAVVGYYHRYCDLFAGLLAGCSWEKNITETFDPSESITVAVGRTFQSLPEPVLTFFYPTWSNNDVEKEQWTKYLTDRRITRRDDINRIVSDRNIDLSFVHLPFPHPPVRYDRAINQFTNEEKDYIDNLALSDLILGEIRRTMENEGTWDESAVIVSSDHQFRINYWKDFDCCYSDNDAALTNGIEDTRIPFFLKLPHQTKPLVYDPNFNTVVTRDLIVDIMKGAITTPDDAANWLDAR